MVHLSTAAAGAAAAVRFDTFLDTTGLQGSASLNDFYAATDFVYVLRVSPQRTTAARDPLYLVYTGRGEQRSTSSLRFLEHFNGYTTYMQQQVSQLRQQLQGPLVFACRVLCIKNSSSCCAALLEVFLCAATRLHALYGGGCLSTAVPRSSTALGSTTVPRSPVATPDFAILMLQDLAAMNDSATGALRQATLFKGSPVREVFAMLSRRGNNDLRRLYSNLSDAIDKWAGKPCTVSDALSFRWVTRHQKQSAKTASKRPAPAAGVVLIAPRIRKRTVSAAALEPVRVRPIDTFFKRRKTV